MTPDQALCRIIYATEGQIPEGSPLLWQLRDLLLAEVQVAAKRGADSVNPPSLMMEAIQLEEPTPPPGFDLDIFQIEVADWVSRNFGSPWTPADSPEIFGPRQLIPSSHPVAQRLEKLENERLIAHQFMGMVEELGELAHSMLKEQQGIRGSAEEHQAKAKDAIGDLLVFMTSYCFRRGWYLPRIAAMVWEEVRRRDWQKNPQTGEAHD